MTTSGVVPQARFSAQARLRALQSDIMELILERELEAGDPLPTESELSVALGVGRNTLRESLKVLQALGVIEIGSSIDVMTPEQLASIEESVKQMEDLAAAGENFVAADAEFHRRLFEPLNNELLINLMGVFWKVYRKIHVEIGAGNEDLVKTAAIHRNIYAAVAAGDKVLAAELLNRHFDGIRRRISEAVGE